MGNWGDELRRRVAAAGLDPSDEADVVDELLQDLEERGRRLRAAGADEAEIGRALLAELGDPGEMARALRRSRSRSPRRHRLAGCWGDVRYGTRVLLRARTFTLVSVVILGLAIGAAATIFSAVNSVLLRPLPYVEPDRLVALREADPAYATARTGASAATLAEWRRASRTLAGIAAFRPWGFELAGDGEPERLTGARVSANLFSLLGIAALHGRSFRPGEDEPGQARSAMLAEGVWRRRFGADPGLIGRSIDLNGEAYEVVGIVPDGFAMPPADVYVPLAFAPYETEQRGNRALSVIGRLRPGVELAAARDDIRGITADLARRFPDSNAGWTSVLTPLSDDVSGPARTPIVLLFTATCVLLALACANVANLLLARSAARRGEMALRAALGATTRRLVRQLVTEGFLLAAASATFGLALAAAAVRIIISRGWGGILPSGRDLHLDPAVIVFVLMLAVMTGLVLAVVPARDATRPGLAGVIRGGVSSRSGRGIGLRGLGIVTQVAAALVLLVSSGLLIRSFLRARATPLGFTPHGVLTMTVSLPARYATPDERSDFLDRARRRIGAIPGVRAAGMASQVPLAGAALISDFMPDRGGVAGGSETPSARVVSITPGYLEAMDIALLRGRPLGETDGPGHPAVVLIDETLARRFWGDGDPVGGRVRVGASIGADTGWREIVGVVTSVRALTPEQPAEATIYLPYAQNAWPTMGIVVATAGGDPRAYLGPVTQAVRELDPTRPLYNVHTLDEIVDRTLGSRRLQTILMSGFAAIALLVSLMGVYGMLAWAVAQRTRELGTRVALGADRRTIVWLCLRGALLQIGGGLLLGTAGALAAGRLLRSVLFSVGEGDLVTLVTAILLLGGAGLLASWLPARRAAGVDPLIALRDG